MANLMIVHRVGVTGNNEVLLNRDHILYASRRATEHTEYTEVTLNHVVPGIGAVLSITEDLGALIVGLSSGPTLHT
jgi:hypothetical protein